jgi:hypothetical protein
VKSFQTVAAFLSAALAAHASIIVSGGGFGANGDLGFVASPPVAVSFGQGAGSGTLYQMDGFLNVAGGDLGYGTGVSAQLTNGAPSGIGFTFSAAQPTANTLLLTYTFVNQTLNPFPGFEFLWFADPDIGDNFADETASVNGTGGPNSFQAGDPVTSSIFFTGLLHGALNNVNDNPAGTPGDVSLALGFQHAAFAANGSAVFQVLLSDNGTHLENFFITQNDPVNTTDSLTVSGQVVPEPAGWLLAGSGLLALAARYRKRRKSIRSCRMDGVS